MFKGPAVYFSGSRITITILTRRRSREWKFDRVTGEGGYVERKWERGANGEDEYTFNLWRKLKPGEAQATVRKLHLDERRDMRIQLGLE